MRADCPVGRDEVISLAPVRGFFSRFRRWLGIGVAGLVLSGAGLVSWAWLISPKMTVGSIEVALGFRGAQDGKYPNDLPFSAEELLDTAVLRAAYERHNLQQWIEFPEFESSLTIGQESGGLRNIFSEYLPRLSASKITGPDRQALEEEYRSRFRSAYSTVFKLEWFDGGRSPGVPSDVKAKVLTDIPVIWAEQSVRNKQIYLFPSLLPGLNANYDKEGESALEKLAAISGRAQALEDGLASVEKLPGAASVALSDGTTLVDLKLQLRAYREQTLPAIQERLLSQFGTEQEKAKLYGAMKLQLKFRENRAKSSRNRLSALELSYRDYIAGRSGAAGIVNSGESADSIGGGFVASFFNRLLGLAQSGADRDYLKTRLKEIEEARSQVTQDELSCQELRENMQTVRGTLAQEGGVRVAASILQSPPPQVDRATPSGDAFLRSSAEELGILLDASRQLVVVISGSYLGCKPELFSAVRGWELKKVRSLTCEVLVLAFVAWVVLGTFILLALLLVKARIRYLGRSFQRS